MIEAEHEAVISRYKKPLQRNIKRDEICLESISSDYNRNNQEEK